MLRNLKSFNLPETEEKVLSFWKEKDIFSKTLKPKRTGSNGKTFNFWEGPPTANGRPGLHHVVARSFKDVVLRFMTMRGYTVPRKAGWDTHGLPVELQVEKQLGLSSKKEIEQYGVAQFNQACKESVWSYKSEWEKMTERMGFWLDIKHPYVTYDKTYVESLWWIIKQFSEKKLLYKGHKIVPWCPRCGTALSSHELAQGYKTTKDTSVFVKFKIQDPKFKKPTFILSWTTTPWTLPGNVALAVGEKISYVFVKPKNSKDIYILAKDLVQAVFKDQEVEITQTVPGKDLVGLSYEPLFHVKSLQKEESYKIYAADFVTTSDGTGVVHTAVMYGEDDYALGQKVGLPQYHTVDEAGKFTDDVKNLAGAFVKSKKTEEEILAFLEKNGNLFAQMPYEHEYPYCWRCGTPLLYYARGSWFVAMSKLKKNLLASNEHIHWVPSHIQKGRFGEWLKDIKDWNFSRERYWGTPLPVWVCDSCGHTSVIGSYRELSQKADRGNTFYIMRHGQGTANRDAWCAGGSETGKFISRLTERGKKDVEASAKKLKKENISTIYASPYHRTKETAHIVSQAVDVPVHFDDRLKEIDFGVFNHKKITDYKLFYKNKIDRFTISPEKGETLLDVRKRMLDFIREIDAKHENEKILIVSHGDPLWMLSSGLDHMSDEDSFARPDFLDMAAYKKITYDHLPIDPSGAIDPHRPYIDAIEMPCEKCGTKPGKKQGIMRRIPEVADVWFDSGAMPFAQEHYPFELSEKKSKTAHAQAPRLFPADYISEAMDQTRGWFYTLLAVATALGLPTPYKNVICLGLIHDKNGQKMSKSKGNVVDPWALIQKYGIDAIRWYFYTLNDPGEAKNFDEQDVVKSLRRLLLVAYNSYSFLNLYGKKKIRISGEPKPTQALDAWILQQLSKTTRDVISYMEAYDIVSASQAIERFTDDLSRWYIRRSRKRLQKNPDPKDWEQASLVLAYVLLQYSKLIAPFTPFFAEALYQSLKKLYIFSSAESVHLESLILPSVPKDEYLSQSVEWVRSFASAVLAKRAEVQIKVRQPLAKVSVKEIPISQKKSSGQKAAFASELLAILKDEINVKEIIEDASLEEAFVLDTEITPELKTEGIVRECIRTVQDLRQEAGYVPKDVIELYVSGNEHIELIVKNHISRLMSEIGAKKIIIGRSEKTDAQIETKIDDFKCWIGMKR